MYCPNCGKAVDEHASFCPNCGCQLRGIPSKQVTDEPASSTLKVISLLIPLAGLILYLVYNETEPIKAKDCGKYALIGVGIGVGLYIIYSVLIVSMMWY